VLFLSNRVYSRGFKSLECVQGYALLAEWAEAGANWGSDKKVRRPFLLSFLLGILIGHPL
jgi:hypothetical protein